MLWLCPNAHTSLVSDNEMDQALRDAIKDGKLILIKRLSKVKILNVATLLECQFPFVMILSSQTWLRNFSPFDGAALRGAVFHVGLLGASKKMAGVAARWVITMMKYVVSVWDFTNMSAVNDVTGLDVLRVGPRSANDAVAFGLRSARPFPAGVRVFGFNDVFPNAGFDGYSNSSHCVNLSYRSALWSGSFTVQPVFEPHSL